MRSLKITGLCFAAMLVTGVSLATSAFAGPPLWLLCLNRGAGNGEFEGSNCIPPVGRKEWASEGVVKSDTVKIHGFSIRFEDSSTKSAIKCNGNEAVGEGLLITEKGVIINEFKFNNFGVNCERVGGNCEQLEKFEGRDLPWEQIIFETEKKTLAVLRGANGKTGEEGEPGWSFTCKKILGNNTDTCITAVFEGKPPEGFELINEITGGILLVRGVLEDSANGDCTAGGRGSFHIRGLVAILLPSGNGLSINLEK